MLVVSDSAQGAVSLVFKTKEDVEKLIDGLQKLIVYKDTFGSNEGYPATYTEHIVVNPREKGVDDHIKGAKKVVTVLA